MVRGSDGNERYFEPYFKLLRMLSYANVANPGHLLVLRGTDDPDEFDLVKFRRVP